jgi:hypothetical protein
MHRLVFSSGLEQAFRRGHGGTVDIKVDIVILTYLEGMKAHTKNVLLD